MAVLDASDQLAITQTYARYAQAIDEKRYDLLDQVFHPTAELSYVVGPHEFTCRGDNCSAHFGEFLQFCFWTNHLIGPPAIEVRDDGAKSTARVIATHIQHRLDGPANRWILRGSYHDQFRRDETGWRIVSRFCCCPDSEGEFLNEGVTQYPDLAWADPARL